MLKEKLTNERKERHQAGVAQKEVAVRLSLDIVQAGEAAAERKAEVDRRTKGLVETRKGTLRLFNQR